MMRTLRSQPLVIFTPLLGLICKMEVLEKMESKDLLTPKVKLPFKLIFKIDYWG